MDKRFKKLANLLVSHSVSLKKDETVEINVSEIPEDMTIALIRAVREAGGIPIVRTDPARVSREIMRGTTESEMKLILLLSLKNEILTIQILFKR